MSVKTPKIPCPKCKGNGRVDMGKELLQTLDLVKTFEKNGEDATAPEIHLLLGDPYLSSTTAINNRLNDLVALGFLTRERHGKTWVYSIVKGKK
jgi:hypothetical protein